MLKGNGTKMTIEGIEAFLNVYKWNSFSKAAKCQFITQPSLSARISSLERELGVVLFDRTPKGISINDNGKRFLPHAQRIISEYYLARRELGREAEELHFGCIPTLADLILPELIDSLKRQYPFVSPCVSEKRSPELIESVRDGRCSFALLAIDHPLDDPELESVFVYADPVLLVSASGHPLSKKAHVTLSEIALEPIIQIDTPSHYGRLILQLFHSSGLNENVTFRCNSMQSALNMIKKGLGIGFLPRTIVKKDLKQKNLDIIRLNEINDKLERKIFFVYKKSTYPFCGDLMIRSTIELLNKCSL